MNALRTFAILFSPGGPWAQGAEVSCGHALRAFARFARVCVVLCVFAARCFALHMRQKPRIAQPSEFWRTTQQQDCHFVLCPSDSPQSRLIFALLAFVAVWRTTPTYV